MLSKTRLSQSKSDPISVRTTRLNNIVLGKSLPAIIPTAKAALRRRSLYCGINNAENSNSLCISAALVDALSREGLLDALCILYREYEKAAQKKHDRNITDFVLKYRSIIEETCRLRVNIDDFNIKTQIGSGHFGAVHLVTERQTGDVYAMKCIKKSQDANGGHFREERDIMSRHSSEWITNLQYAFQDNCCLYLIMEYLPGGDLLNLMLCHRPLSEHFIRFYLAELTEAIHALHEMGYVHRDIKPENILIDRFGHLKLADFGNAAALNRDGHVLTSSPVGTPDYIAPELLQTLSTDKVTRTLHDMSCDFWSMGIIGYEMIYEITPFYDENVHETYSKILTYCEHSSGESIVNFPSERNVSDELRQLLESLIVCQTQRLDYIGIRRQPFFAGVQWDRLREQVPPIIPNVNNEIDTSNFTQFNTRNKKKICNINSTCGNIFSSSHIETNFTEFTGQLLPYIGYSYVYEHENTAIVRNKVPDMEVNIQKLQSKLTELQTELSMRSEVIKQLKQEALRAEQITRHSDSNSKLLEDAKQELHKMKDIIKEKTLELATCRTTIKTLQGAVKIEQEMWQKNEATIAEVLRLNKQKYDEAKIASDQNYEKTIAEKKTEIKKLKMQLSSLETELNTKVERCTDLEGNVSMVQHSLNKQINQLMKQTTLEKERLMSVYEQQLNELRLQLRKEQEAKAKLAAEFQTAQNEFRVSIGNIQVAQESASTNFNKNYDEMLQRLNEEIKLNNTLNQQLAEWETKFAAAQKQINELKTENTRLERETQVSVCSQNSAISHLNTARSPYATAHSSMTDVYEQSQEQLELLESLEVARESINAEKKRADNLQDLVQKLEQMLKRIDENSLSPSKNQNTTDGFLERKNEKLEDQLVRLRENLVLERQASRTANLNSWKLEKQLDELHVEQKRTKVRLQMKDENIKRIEAECEKLKNQYQQAQNELALREERTEELKKENAELKCEVRSEHLKWEKAEKERIKNKSEIIERIMALQRVEEQLQKNQQKLKQLQAENEGLTIFNKRLQQEFLAEQERANSAIETNNKAQIELKRLKISYEQLMYACTVTDNQLTDVEQLLKNSESNVNAKIAIIDELNAELRSKDEKLTSLEHEYNQQLLKIQAADANIKALKNTLEEEKNRVKQLQNQLVAQHEKELAEQKNLYTAQEQIEVLNEEMRQSQLMKENYVIELRRLQEENTRILTELYYVKDEVHRLQEALKNSEQLVNDQHADCEELQNALIEKEHFFKERDIKAETTLAQHKKLIDYLQMKVEDLMQHHKKKKTLTDRLFGHTSGNENISPAIIESSILYRTLQAELTREKQQRKLLQEQISKLDKKDMILKQAEQAIAAEKEADGQQENIELSTNNEVQNHNFQLELESSDYSTVCLVCEKILDMQSPHWKCKECKNSIHRNCRGNVEFKCNYQQAITSTTTNTTTDTNNKTITTAEIANDTQQLNEKNAINYTELGSLPNAQRLILDVAHLPDANQLQVHCGYEIEEHRILLLGCSTGLYALHMPTSMDTKDYKLLHIPIGIKDCITSLDISPRLAKVLLVGANGEALYQCDYRQLLSRCCSEISRSLEATVLNLPFANRSSTEKWQMVRISNETKNPLDSVAIAATSTRIVILKYKVKLQEFKPVRAIDTTTSVTSILYTEHTALVASNKFYEIDLNIYEAEEFLDMVDNTVSHLRNAQPVTAIRISPNEFLLCYMECGIFVDAFGTRSRPYDINWKYTSTAFAYNPPILYVAHKQSIQLIRLPRSYTNSINPNNRQSMESLNQLMPDLKRVFLPSHMPTLLTASGKSNMYVLLVPKSTDLQQLYCIDIDLAFEQTGTRHDSISSVGTALTITSDNSTESNM